MRASTPRRATGLVLASLVAASLAADSATALEVRTYFDLDNNATTGCAAVTAAGALTGMELLLVATVDTGVNPHVVTALTRQVCSGGVFGAAIPVDTPYPSPWGVGDRNGADDIDVIELYVPRTALPNAYTVRLAFATAQGGDSDALVTAAGGAGDPPILFQLGEPVPALSVGAAVLLALLLAAGGALLSRRPGAVFLALVLLVGAVGVAWAAVVLDGNPADWEAMSCCAHDPVGDAGAGADITAAHVCVEGDVVYLRLDAGRNAAPLAVDDQVATDEEAVLNGSVLAANPTSPDTDADLDSLTVAAVNGSAGAVGVATTLASGAVVTVRADGAFTYDPNGAFASLCPGGTATDSFTYTVSDGHGGSATATVTVTVNGLESAAVDIEKLVNGEDADLPPGPTVFAGTSVQWTYVVANTGAVDLSQVSVTDDRGVVVTCPKTALAPGESMTCTATGTATVGQYANVGTSTGRTPCAVTVADTDPAHYFGVLAAITLEKLTNGEDADLPPGPTILVGATVQWTYVVTNTGDVRLAGVSVTDNRGVAVTCPKTALDPGESMTCTGSGIANAGQYSNIGTATGTPAGGSVVTASDPSHYYGQAVGTQGCTPAYWKNHTDDWPPTGYSPPQTVNTAFVNVTTYYPTLGNATLLQALSFGGGPGSEGAAEILLRAGVGALLNAAHPSVAYPRTTAAVLADINAALLQSRDPMLALAAALDADNNRGCPLN